MNNYEEGVRLLKALADPNRALIIDMLSCEELCACDLLEHLDLSQPTLSHHMKLLSEAGLIRSRNEGKWTYYSLNPDRVLQLKQFIARITSAEPDCVCQAPAASSACPAAEASEPEASFAEREKEAVRG